MFKQWFSSREFVSLKRLQIWRKRLDVTVLFFHMLLLGGDLRDFVFGDIS